MYYGEFVRVSGKTDIHNDENMMNSPVDRLALTLLVLFYEKRCFLCKEFGFRGMVKIHEDDGDCNVELFWV